MATAFPSVRSSKRQALTDKGQRPPLFESLESRVLLSTTTVLSDTFEYSSMSSFLSNWQVNLDDSGRVWGPNTVKKYGGSYSVFSSDDGYSTWSTAITTRTYVNSEYNWMRRGINLSGYDSASMTVRYYTNTESGCDGFRVDVDGSTIHGTNREGNSGGWREMTVDLSPYCGNSHVDIMFVFYSDGSVIAGGDAGVWVDNLTVIGVTNDPPPNHPPDPAEHIAPENGATGVGLTPTLRCSQFSDPDPGDTQQATLWGVFTSPNESARIWYNYDTDSDMTREQVPSGVLSYSTTYYWSVGHQDNHDAYSAGSGWWSFTTMAAPDDSYEQNDSSSTAHDFGPLTSQQTWTNLKGYDDDWYKFTMLATGGATDDVMITFTDSQGDLDLYVYRSDGTTEWDHSASTTDNETVSLSGAPAGTYYVKVYPFGSGMNPNYSLTIDPPAASDDSYEQNDSSSTAHDFGTLTSQQTWTNLKGYDDDWYKFTMLATGGSTDDVTINFTDSQGDLDLFVYGPNGTTEWGRGTSATDNETVSLSGAPAGTYYVEISPFGSAMNPNYSLTIDPPAAASVVTISGTDSSAGEPSNNGRYRISRTSPTSSALAVSFSVSGSAKRSSDYQLKVGSTEITGSSVTIPAGQSYVDVTLEVIDDSVVESTESATLTVTSGSGYTVGSPSSSTINITDNDPESSDRQVVTAGITSVSGMAGGNISSPVAYTTSTGDNTLTGLGLRVHYDSSKVTWNAPTDLLGSPTVPPGAPVDDASDYDGNSATDKYVLIAWADIAGNWPNVSLPAELFTANLTLSDQPDGTQTLISFSSSSTASGYSFESTPIVITWSSFSLDVDGNGGYDALTDGILILRYMFGQRTDPQLTAGAVGAGATRTTADAITSYLDDAGDTLDVDGNGSVDALTDGILILRYLFGQTTDPQLTQGAVGAGASRTTAAQISSYLQPMVPVSALGAALDAESPLDLLASAPSTGELAAISVMSQESLTTSSSVAGDRSSLLHDKLIRASQLTPSLSSLENPLPDLLDTVDLLKAI